MVPDIWQTDLYSHEGKYWQVPERQILPKPYQNPHPPIWVAALQPSTYEIAASKGNRRAVVRFERAVVA